VLAAALGRDGREQEAAALVEEVIAAEPKLQPAYLVLASLYPDDPETRIAAYRRGLTALPGDSQLGFELGAEYQRLGRRDEAIALFEELLVANPTLDWVRNDLAATLLEERADDPASVQRAVQLAESLRPTTNPLVLDTIGWAYQRAGRHEEAIDYLERAAAGAAGQPAVHYHLGMAYLAAGDAVRARQSLEQSLSAGTEFAQSGAARRALAGLEPPAPN
jgi:tetratricopeptide (TPR) repeat protein